MPDINSVLESWRLDAEFRDNVTSWKVTLAYQGRLEPFPQWINPRLRQALSISGVEALYSHQVESLQYIHEGENVVIATGTASGKTLCYDIPVLNRILDEPGSTALYLFPTKALTQDQLRNLLNLGKQIVPAVEIQAAIYDGDTPSHHRSAIRKSASILLTNPDMLHQGILPHHTLWMRFFKNLRYVVIDEVHTYRGVFGSHFANIMRRLKRICAFYGAYPQFILTSATIGNPLDLAENLVEGKARLVDQDASPHGERHFLVYNPALLDEQLGLRKSSLQTSVRFARSLMSEGHQTLVFARTRRTVEMILTYLLEQIPTSWRSWVRGYRSGYLKADRREIEQGLKSGLVRAVVATSALELGIDIGDLESVIMVGYPGSIATTRQRAGRAGRKQQAALAILVTSPDAMDQYLAQHPDYLTGGNPENALIDADNVSILLQHLRCASFELPFNKEDGFGALDRGLLQAFLDALAAGGEVNQQAGKYYWVGQDFPAAAVSLRSTTPSVISLQVERENGLVTIGEIDAASAAWLVHPEAIYLHEAEVYEVLALDLENGTCLLKPADPDYYTMPGLQTTIEQYEAFTNQPHQGYTKNFGSLSLRLEVKNYRKIRWLTNETVGTGSVDLPPRHLETTGAWLNFEPPLIEKLRAEGKWTAFINDYGPGWPRLREKILLRDDNRCRGCGQKFEPGRLHVHHIQPFKSFASTELANAASNLATLCPACHQKAEVNVRMRSGLAGAGNALRNLAPLLIMCDREDISMLTELQSVLNDGQPALLVYDNIPGGLGLSEKLYERHQDWIERAVEMINDCPCAQGCPACVGPIGEVGYGGKDEALALLKAMM